MDTEAVTSDSITKLKKVIAILRDPKNGGRWDKKQNHKSLIPYVLEEAHEVVEAIRENNDQNLCEELGDLLLQVVLHAQIAEEENRFSFEDVITVLTNKLIRRNPSIFNTQNIKLNKNEAKSWEDIKNSEKKFNHNKFSSMVEQKIKPQSALFGSIYISKQAANIGFEWESIKEVWKKFDEEIHELKEALIAQDLVHAEEEFGDVMFTLVNIARWYKIQPEEALSVTNKKFIKRLHFIESQLKGNIKEQPLNKLHYLWKKAKQVLKEENK